jgi:LysM repeat protein
MLQCKTGKRPISDLLLLLAGMALLSGAAFAEPSGKAAGQAADDVPLVSADALSPQFLGMYRKVMEIEDQIQKHSLKYQVDLALARAVCMYESGGNAGLRSVAGAQGYFQVMPATFRSLRVRTNIEAGVKYLGQLTQRFTENDAVLAAYNGGPTRVARGRVLPLETKQYVMGVLGYREVLEAYEPTIREIAGQLRIETVRRGEDWWQLAQRLEFPLVQLRLYNPFLAARTLRAGYRVVYPAEPRAGLMATVGENALYYRTRLGDNIINLAFALGVDLGALREANRLDPLQPLAPGTMLEIPLAAKFKTYRVASGDSIPTIGRRLGIDPWTIVRDNLLWNQTVEPGMELRIRERPPAPAYVVHRVRSGDTLSSIARRYGTTIRAIQQSNSMGRSTLIRIGQRLRIRRG